MAPRVEDLLEDIKNILAAQAAPAPAPGGGTSAQDAIDLAERNRSVIEASLAATQSLISNENDVLRIQRLKIDEQQQLLQIEQESLKIQKAKGQSTALEEDEIRKITAELRNQQKIYDNLSKSQSDARDAAQDIANKLGLGNVMAGGLAAKIAKTAISAGSISGAMKSVGAQFFALARIAGPLIPLVASMAATAKLIGKVVSETKELVISADQLRSRFVAVTADASNVRAAFIDLTMANLDLAIGFEQMQNAQLGLRSGFVDFVFMSDAARKSLTLQTAVMEKLGVDNRTTAETMTMLTQSFGQSGEQALQTQRNIVGFGRAFGMEAGEIVQEFNNTMPALAEFGDRAEDVFKGLIAASREAGVSVGRLTSVFGEAMNSFEGSAKVAGALNAVLGTGMVNSMDLLRASTEQRIEMIKQSIEMSGRDFASMSRFEKITLANAVGLRDVDEAARIFGSTQDDLATKIGDTVITQEEMENLAREATDSFTQLKFAFMSFAVAVKPVTELFAEMVDKFIEFSDGFPGGVAGLVSSITAAAGAITSLMGLGLMFVPGAQALGAMSIAGGATMMAGGLGVGGLAMAAEETMNDGMVISRKGQPVFKTNMSPQDSVVAVARRNGVEGVGDIPQPTTSVSLDFEDRMVQAIGRATSTQVAAREGELSTSIENKIVLDGRELKSWIREAFQLPRQPTTIL